MSLPVSIALLLLIILSLTQLYLKNSYNLYVEMLKQKSLQSRLNATKSIFLIGDEGCDKSFIFDFLQLEQQELSQEINIYVKVSQNLSSIQLYDFPADKLVRDAIQLYLKLLSQPVIIMYFMKSDGPQRDIRDWIGILNKCNILSKIIFISDVTTYTERQKILNRIAKEFQTHILDIILFAKLQPYTFRRAFDHLEAKGISIDSALCLRPTFTKKIINSIQKIIKNLKKRKSIFGKNQEEPSVI